MSGNQIQDDSYVRDLKRRESAEAQVLCSRSPAEPAQVTLGKALRVLLLASIDLCRMGLDVACSLRSAVNWVSKQAVGRVEVSVAATFW